MFKFSDWQKRWRTQDIPWTAPEDDDWFFKQYSVWKKDYNLQNKKRVLLPLSGNSPAIFFFDSYGHDVTGIEFVREPIESFFKEHFPDKEIERNQNTWKFQNITLLQADFFAQTFESEFDFIYDRASLIALSPNQREQYARQVLSALKENGLLFISAFEVNGPEIPGPPFPITKEEIRTLYSSLSELEYFEEEVPAQKSVHIDAGIETIRKTRFLLQG